MTTAKKMRGVFHGTNKIKLEQQHQFEKDAATYCEKNANEITFLTVAYKNNFIYGKVLINGFEPLRPFSSLSKWIDLCKYVLK